MDSRITFIVPVRNDAARLDVCLTSIVKNEPVGSALEVVVVDNGSIDGSPAVARRHGAVVLDIPDGKVSSLRNCGALHGTGEVLAFVDADNEIAQGWLAAARENLSSPGVGATGALYAPPRDGTWVQHAYGILRGRSRRRAATDWLGSGNLAVTRAAFDAIGGFDTALEACEDVDFCARLRAAGFTLLSDPRLGSIHHGDPRTLRALFVGEMWRGRDNLRVSFRRPIAWKNIPSALVPVIDLLMIGALLAGLAGAAAGWRLAPSVIAAAAGVVLAAAALRTWRVCRSDRAGLASLAPVFVVVLVYDVARALAVVMKTSHRNAQPAVAAAAS